MVGGIGMVHVMFDETAIAKYLYNRLIQDGYVPTADEAFTIAEYVFDYLIEIGAMDTDSIELEEEE